jgi:hypothetical protein
MQVNADFDPARPARKELWRTLCREPPAPLFLVGAPRIMPAGTENEAAGAPQAYRDGAIHIPAETIVIYDDFTLSRHHPLCAPPASDITPNQLLTVVERGGAAGGIIRVSRMREQRRGARCRSGSPSARAQCDRREGTVSQTATHKEGRSSTSPSIMLAMLNDAERLRTLSILGGCPKFDPNLMRLADVV